MLCTFRVFLEGEGGPLLDELKGIEELAMQVNTYAIARVPISACAAFSDTARCWALILTPSAVMTSGSTIPTKANTLFK